MFVKLKNKINRIAQIISEKDHLKIFFVFLFFFSCFGAVYFSLSQLISLDDHLFHIRFAEIVKERGFGIFKDFHWIYFSKISQGGDYLIYYNFLFYLALIPFTFIGSLITAIKLYGLVILSFSLTILYYFLSKIGVRRPFFWVVIFVALANYGSMSRFLLARPYTLTPALLILELYFLYRKKYWGVFLVSFLYLYWHAATFFFPLMIAVVFIVFENFYGRKVNTKLLLSSLGGVALAFLGAEFIVGGLWNYMTDITFKVFYYAAIGKADVPTVGAEVYPVNFFDYMRNSLPVAVLFFFASIFEIYQYIQARIKKIDPQSYFSDDKNPLRMTLFFLSLMFFLGIFFSQRYADYFMFFSIAYIAVSVDAISGYIDFKKEMVRKSLGVASFVVVGYLFIGNLLFLQNQIAGTGSHKTFEAASNWLKNNSDKGEIVYNPSWDWFPALFYWNSNNYYVTGLEPRFLYDYDPQLYWAWWNMSVNGYLCFEQKCEEKENKYESLSEEEKSKWRKEEGNKMAEYIKNNFHSRFIITTGQFQNFSIIVGNNDNFEKVFTDDLYKVYVYKIK